MDHSQRTTTADSSNPSANASSASMPNVLFREIHKNAFLKRHSSDRRTGFPRKSERVWVVFCVHDDVEPFLEIYPDQKVALTHKPEWFASLSSVLHVSPTICGHEDEFEFAVTLSFQVVRLAAPSWESMMEWVETIRNKLRELKVLCPKENVYSRMPEQKQPLLPTRDPNSPLPLPPEGPSTLLPGVELVHVQSRNGSISQDSGDNSRHQRDAQAGNNVTQLRQVIKRRNERDNRSATETSQQTESPSSSVNAGEETNGEEVSQVSINSGLDLQKKKTKVKRAASVPQATPSTSQITSGSNVTVIEVSTAGNRGNHSASEFNSTDYFSDSDGAGADDVFYSASSGRKSDVKNVESNGCEEEAHYESVFLSSIQINKPQLPKILNSGSKIAVKAHLTNMMINSNNSMVISSSLNENGPSTSTSVPPIHNINSVEVQTGISTSSANLCKNTVKTEEADSISTDREEIHAKLEKVNISGLIPRIPGKSSKQGIPKSIAKDSNLNIVESRKCSIESLPVQQPNFPTDGRDVTRLEISENVEPKSSGPPAYSQVVKVAKVKVKTEVAKTTGKINSPVFPKKKKNSSDIQIVEEEEEGGGGGESRRDRRSENPTEGPSRNPNKVTPLHRNKNLGVVNINLSREGTRSPSDRNQPSSNVSNEMESRMETNTPAASTSVSNRTDNSSKKDSTNGFNNNPEVEPMAATVQPAVGVITVEDIPLIGGHQRRRRRSSSTENAIPVPNNPSSSRGIGGADRIRINIAQASGVLPAREERRCEMETRTAGNGRNVTDQIVHINVAPQSSRLTLREQQVLQLKKEMLHPGGVRLQLRRKDCTGSIALVDAINGVWVAGWKQKEHPLLYNALHIGDQLISVGEMVVRSSSDAQKLIRNSTSLYVEFIIRRIPFGKVFALQKSAEGQNLGIVQEGNTAEIKEVVPNGLAARQGLTTKTLSHDGSSLTNWFLTEINGRPLNLFFKDNEVRDRLNAVGKEISILVQPHDFVKQIKKQLKNIRGYKDYIVQ